MENKNRIDKKLAELDEGIIWEKERQQHVRKRLIRQMEYGNSTPISWMRRRFIPVFSLLLLVTIVTTIFLSEFTGQDIADKENNNGHHNGGDQTQLATNDDKKNKDTHNDQTDVENNSDNDNISPEKPVEENNDTETNSNEADDTQQNDRSDERILTEKEVLDAIEGQITTELEVILPSSLPLADGQHLTATTDSNAHQYEVVFYQHGEPIPINNQLLFSDENPAEVIARLTVQQYDTQEEADDMIAYEEFDEQSGEEVKLGLSLKGYQDAGAGSIWTSFNIGRWAFAAQASTQNPDKSESLAKEVGDYLQDNMLPIPKPNGFAHFDAENSDNRILWEKEKTVYMIDEVDDPMDALDIAIDFQ